MTRSVPLSSAALLLVAGLHRGALARGLASFAFDGRGDDGRPLASGRHFLRFSTPLDTRVTRIVRAR